MTAKELYKFLAEKGFNKKLNKRELYDEIIAKFGISTKQLGGYVSVLSRKHAVSTDKITLTVREIEWDTVK